MLKYTDYYRRFGIRRAMQVVVPKLNDLADMSLPRESILHFLPTDGVDGIDPSVPFIARWNGQVYSDHVMELTEVRGNPRRMNASVSTPIRQYHRKYRRIRQLRDFDRLSNDKISLIVEDYALLPRFYRYPANIYRAYNQWYNIQGTLWNRVNELAQKSTRQQFIEMRLPPILPSKKTLTMSTGKVSSRLLGLMPDSESLYILEIWKWLMDFRDESYLTKLTPEALKQTNLVFIETGKFVVINLGLLDEWRAPSKAEIAAGTPNRMGIPPAAMANRFLRMLMTLVGLRNGGDAEHGLKEDPSVVDEDDDGPARVEERPVTLNTRVVDEDPETHADVEREESVELVAGKTKLEELVLADIDETEANIAKIDEIVAKDLEALDRLHLDIGKELDAMEEENAAEKAVTAEPMPVLDAPMFKEASLKEGVMAKANQLADMGVLSGAEYRRLEALSTAFEKLPDPFGSGKTLDKAFVITEKDKTLDPKPLAKSIKGVTDPSMLHSSVESFDRQYIDQCLSKDIGNTVLAVQRAGIAVTGFTREEYQDALNHYDAFTVQLTPVRGKASTVRFRLPRVDSRGVFVAEGVKYRMAKQRSDYPIRKVDAGTVALTSYYGKVFVTRSEKKVDDYPTWLTNEVSAIGMDPANDRITEVLLANVYDNYAHTPRIYSILGMRFRSFMVGKLHFTFDYETRDTLVSSDVLKKIERHGMVVCGLDGKDPLVVGKDDVFYRFTDKHGLEALGTMEAICDIDPAKAPKETAEIKIGGKHIPVGIFLAYELGFTKLLQALEAKPLRVVKRGERLNLDIDEYRITFADESYVFPKESTRNGLILQSIAKWNDGLSAYSRRLFESKTIYLNLFDRQRLGIRFLRETDLLTDLFIDPISLELLKAHHDPVTFIGLVVKACELLETDWARDETDLEDSRIKGYERFAGALYGELVRAIRIQRARGTAKAPIEMHPDAVWMAVNNDPSKRLIEESNPIHELKGQEEVTFGGTGGRSGRSMVGRTRLFHHNDLGVISEATKDSADVAITTFLTANPNLTNVRGETSRLNLKDAKASSVLSTSALMAPLSDRDDLRRVGFVSIQNSSSTYVTHQRAMPLRTGYDKVIAERVSDLFAATAKEDGKVTKVTPHAIEVTYKDGSVSAYPVGRAFGKVAGLTIPHDVVTSLREGDKLAKGDLIAYNENYFEPDPLDRKHAQYKAGVLLNTALMENAETLEDSSTISEGASRLMATRVTKIKELVLGFDQAIHGLLTPGTPVEADSILCTVEDAITADQRFFDEKSLDTLRTLAANTPRAKVAGTVDKVEVFYNGDFDDLSPTLQDVTRQSDMRRKREARDLRKPYSTGQVRGTFRVGKNALLPNQVAILVYITVEVACGTGDKGVFSNQLKTVFGRVMTGTNETADTHEAIDATFGYKPISDRIVTSPVLIGTTNTLLKLIGQRAAKLYLKSTSSR